MDRRAASGFDQLRQRYSKLPPIRFYDHHKSHAAAAYLTSGLDSAAIATIDFSGGPYSTVIWKGERNAITRIRAEGWYNSLGELYWKATQFLGFGEFAEGKTMGLAPYGDSKRFEAIFAAAVENGAKAKAWPWFSYAGWPPDDQLGCSARTTGNPLDEPYPSVAASAQLTLERAVNRIVRGAIAESNSRNLCLGGGVALNCSSNGALLDSDVADEVWVFPGSSDSGLSVGAALLCAAESGELGSARLQHAYWGPEFSNDDCAAALTNEPQVSFRRVEGCLEDELAGALAAGMIIGVCRGRMEFGPRALGNRSILADPRRIEIRDRVNRIKSRELWRPLAPAVLAERAGEFFNLGQPSPFMLFRAQVNEAKRSIVPAIVHVDGSARPQTIRQEQNRFFYNLISAFERRTGVPILLNTSFNDASEPIVCSPADAIKTFLKTGLDLLVLGDFVVRRTSSGETVGRGVE
jgi:carbamoyltransferase